MNNKISGIYAITPNQKLELNSIDQVFNQYKISILQYRHKNANEDIKIDEANKLRQLCLRHNTLFIINDDVNLAQKISADGVHLGKNDSSVEQARKQLGNQAIIGVSCYDDIDLAKQAQKQGANYVAFGSLFPSTTKPNAPLCPLDLIIKAKQKLNIPIVGIGGIDFNNQHQAFDAGCDAVAMISALFQSTD
ncbi:thiamine phosphate synthase [Candidatus Thioglobus sp.]|uniref:thiamine phosphate synthase n=1 Tax=Candidatus Thioglobus sp. TaxID=2026721 RepID=UPI0032428A4C